MKHTNYLRIEHSDDDGYGQFYMLDDIEHNNAIQQKTRKHKLSDPCIDELVYINQHQPPTNEQLPIIYRMMWCLGFTSCYIIFIYSYW